MKLTKIEAMLLNGAEECRRRAMVALDRGGDLVVLAQDLADAASSYQQVADEVVIRARAEARRAGP